MKVDDVRNIPVIVDSYLNGSNPSDLVLLQLDSERFPRRILDFPEDVRKYMMTHPRVKVEWNKKNTEFRKSYYSLNEKFNNIDEKIILTMTSYPGRINGVLKRVKLLFENTIKPDRLVLNLSTEEFPNKEKDLPSELVEYRNRERNFEIYWVDDNTKPYKKTIPTLRRFPSDVIISVDDDINYPRNFI